MKRCVRSIVLVACATSITAVAVAAPVRWSANGHYYQAVRVGTPISWADANQAAKALGPGWHLATITSAQEDVFVRGLFGRSRCTRPTFWSPTILLTIQARAMDRWLPRLPVKDVPVGYRRTRLVYCVGHGTRSSTDARFRSPTLITSGGLEGSIGRRREPGHSNEPIAYIAELSAPPANPGLELTQTTVAGCKSVTGRVNISSPAPAGGLVVSLRNTLYSASTPASLTIPAGATSQSFQITTSAVREVQTGKISATFGGKKFSRQLIVRPMGLQSLALSASTVVGGTR